MNWKRIADTIQAATNVLLFYAAIVVLGLVLIAAHGCARFDQTNTVKAEGDATIHIVVGVDTAVCDELPAEDRLECIQSIVDMAKVMTEKDDSTLGSI